MKHPVSYLKFLPPFVLIVLLLSSCAMPFDGNAFNAPTATTGVPLTPTPTLTETPAPTATITPLPVDAIPTFILSINDNGYAHLFGFSPGRMPLTRLTNGLWDDVAPSLSPDGQKAVFASNRNNYWDLYLLDLTSGQLSRLTDTPEYDGNPSWSPDSQWIVYETYLDSSLEINILSTVDDGQVIRLSHHPAAEANPVWSPQGRKVALVSNRSGDNEIWIASLDQPEDRRFVNLSQSPHSQESHPAWSPDGIKLAWASARPNQSESIYVWDATAPGTPPRRIGSGNWPAWSEDGEQIATRVQEPNQDYLAAYRLNGELVLPPMSVAAIRGIDWRTIRVGHLPSTFEKTAFLTPTPPWKAQAQPQDEVPGERLSVVKLSDVQAPHPLLHDAVDEAFVALRRRVVAETGWDALASLANAYEPLTSTLDPGRGEDWLYTGRAFALNTLTLNVGWTLVAREDIAGQTYWRVYMRALAQDGSQGEPLSSIPWDLNARYSLDPLAYDQGGAAMKSIPSGYWIDFTMLAGQYGWQRVAAQNNWRMYFAGTQYNEFILTDGLDWHNAMMELYPPDIFITPTVVVPPTATLTRTPFGFRYQSPTPTITKTLTPQPTFTPNE